MKYYYSSAGYIISPDSRRIARIKEFDGWRVVSLEICDTLNDGTPEETVLSMYKNQLEEQTWKPSN